jgi:tetratricopeptide (TPR) repeat protein
LAIDPNNVVILSGKGTCLSNLGVRDEAIKYFDKALAIDPDYSSALVAKGNFLNKIGEDKQAIEFYDKAIYADFGVSV